MSLALTTAIYQRLSGQEILSGDFLAAQQRLATLLGVDTDTDLPAVHAGNSSDVVVYPCITFRPAPGLINKMFTRGTIAVDYPFYDLEFWCKSQADSQSVSMIAPAMSQSGDAPAFTGLNACLQIGECVDTLLDQRFGAPLLPLACGTVLTAKAALTLATFYDNKRHAWWGLTRYHFTERRL